MRVNSLFTFLGVFAYICCRRLPVHGLKRGLSDMRDESEIQLVTL